MTDSTAKTGLDGVVAAVKAQAPGRGLPPVHLWNPAHCGEIDIVIRKDGLWFHEGTPIGREALVRLFSTVLRKDPDGRTYLVTPVEKVGIRVVDAPFVAVEMAQEGEGAARRLRFRTNVDEWVPCDSDHPLRFDKAADGGLIPYLHVRADLWAKVTRALYYDLVAMGEARMVDGAEMFGVASDGMFFAMADAAQARDET